MKGAAWWASDQGPLPDLQMATFSLCPLIVAKRESKLPSHQGFILWPHLTLITSLPQMQSHWELGLKYMNLRVRGHHSIQRLLSLWNLVCALHLLQFQFRQSTFEGLISHMRILHWTTQSLIHGHWLQKSELGFPGGSVIKDRHGKAGTEDEMIGWHHQLNGHEFEWTPGAGNGQEAWHAAVHGVAKSQTGLSDWTELAKQETQGWSLVWEDPPRSRATEPVRPNSRACALEPRRPQPLKPTCPRPPLCSKRSRCRENQSSTTREPPLFATTGGKHTWQRRPSTAKNKN